MGAISRAGTAYNSWALELSHFSLDSASFFDIVELGLILNIAEMMIAGRWAIPSQSARQRLTQHPLEKC